MGRCRAGCWIGALLLLLCSRVGLVDRECFDAIYREIVIQVINVMVRSEIRPNERKAPVPEPKDAKRKTSPWYAPNLVNGERFREATLYDLLDKS
jgi:Major prion protein bPrPp - N terminal